jgi:histidine phosphotransfer protein HptB
LLKRRAQGFGRVDREPWGRAVLIDKDRVKELMAEIGPDDFAEVAELFLEEADEAIGRLTAGASAKALESDLHFLKGSALNLGFADLAALCQDGERRAAAGDTALDLAAVHRCYADSKRAFAEVLTGNSPI